MLLSKFVATAAPFFLKGAVDRLAAGGGGARKAAVVGLLMHGVAKIAASFLHEMRNGVFSRAGQRLGRRTTLAAFRQLLALDAQFFNNARTGALTRVVDRGTRSVMTVFRSVVFAFIPSAFELLLVCGILVRTYSLSIVGVLVATFVAYCWWTTVMSSVLGTLRGKMNAVDSEAAAKITDSLFNADTVALFNNAKVEGERFDLSLREYETLAVRNEWLYCWQNAVQTLLFVLGLTGMLVISAFKVSSGAMTVGDLVMVSSLLQQMWAPLQIVGWQFRETKQALVDLSNLFAVVEQKPKVADAPDAKPLEVTGGRVVFENVSFSYPEDEVSTLPFSRKEPTDEKEAFVVSDIESDDDGDESGAPKSKPKPRGQSVRSVSFTVEPGQTVALVGASGAGKSSALRLLTRIYDVTGGRILIDGQDIRDVTQESLRDEVCVIPQSTILWNDTIAYNIRYGRMSATFDEVVEAAKAAALHSTIMRMPNGYNTVVGERGVRLSGGEAQRLSAARALLKGSPILLQDEATAALDSRTEAEVTKSLNAAGAKKTRLVVAHRLATVLDADMIVVMRYGRVVEMGTHSELLENEDGIYADMWRRQSEGQPLDDEEVMVDSITTERQ